MKILIVESSPISLTSNVAVHVRNSIEIHKHLSLRHDCKLVSKEEEVLDVQEQYDFIIFVSASFYFKYERFLQLVNNQNSCKVGWISNEIDLFLGDALKQRGIDFIIANFEQHGVKKAHKHDKFLMTNLNTLIAKERNPATIKEYDTVYYGTYRKWREKYFEKYLQGDVILSTSTKNIKKFQLLGCDCQVTDPLSWEKSNETLNQFKSGIYIEDSITHKVFNHLANRWLESLYCNVAMFFDKSCKGTIDKDAFIIDPWFMIDSYEELVSKTKEVDKMNMDAHFDGNTKIALQQKTQCLTEIEKFLLNY